MLKWVKPPKASKLTSLDKIRLLPSELKAAASSKPGDLSEQEWYDAGKHLLDLTSRSNNINARKTFAWAIFTMVSVWLAAVLTVTILSGAKMLVLDKTVLIALIISGSANVISLFSLVAKYLFHVHETHEPGIELKIGTHEEAPAKPDAEFSDEAPAEPDAEPAKNDE